MAKKKIVRKKIKRPSSGKKPYFTKDTQRAINEFCEEPENHELRAELYRLEIRPALEKLAENLIFVYGFHKQHDDVEHLKHTCVINLYENLHKFDHTRGSNAFSYFNVVAKNWLIIQSRRKHKRQKRLVYMDDKESLSMTDEAAIASYSVAPDPSEAMDRIERMVALKAMLKELESRARNDAEKRCCAAISHVFDNVDQLDFLNKRAVFVYVRDISGLNSKQLSVCMSSIRKIYREIAGPDKKFDIF